MGEGVRKALTWISHQPSAAVPRQRVSTALRLENVPDVLSSDTSASFPARALHPHDLALPRGATRLETRIKPRTGDPSGAWFGTGSQ